MKEIFQGEFKKPAWNEEKKLKCNSYAKKGYQEMFQNLSIYLTQLQILNFIVLVIVAVIQKSDDKEQDRRKVHISKEKYYIL